MLPAPKPEPFAPDDEAEQLLAAVTEAERKQFGPLVTGLSLTSDRALHLKAARAVLFLMQDGRGTPCNSHDGSLSVLSDTHAHTKRASGPP